MLTRRWLPTCWTLTGAAWRAGLMWVCLLWAPWAHALELQYTHPFADGALAGVARSLTISGELQPGDTAKLVQWMRRKPADAWHGLGRVALSITGGDHTEALLLAETLANLYPFMVASTDCVGPCAIVWLSGAWRLLPQGRIGLRKPVATVGASSKARPGDAPPAYDPFPARLRNYLSRQGLPSPLHERLLSDRDDPVYWLSEQDINATGTWPPYYYEKLHAKCPRLAATEESFHALRRCAARLMISQKAFAFDKLLAGVNDPWWNENKDLFFNAPR